MRATWMLGVLAGLATLAAGGCVFQFGDSSLLSLLHVAGSRAYFAHYEEWSGFAELESTLWEIDLNTGDSAPLAAAAVRYDTQATDDYVAAEVPTSDNEGSRIVATRISDGKQIVVLERDVPLGGRYDRVFVLVDDRIVALTAAGVLVYDLDAEEVERTIAVADPLVELLAASDEWALVTRDNVHSGDQLLISLTTEDVVTVPDIAAGRTGLFFDAALVGDSLFAASVPADDSAERNNTVEALHIPTLTWETLADYGDAGTSVLFPESVFVRGANSDYVLVEHIDRSSVARVELIDRETGTRQEVGWAATAFGGAVLHPQLGGDLVHWLDDADRELVTYDITTGAKTTTTVNVPN